MEDRFSFQAPRGRKVNHKYLDREPVLDHPVLGRLADNCAVESVRKHSLTSFVKLPVAKPLLSGIEIHGWTITSIKAPISSQAEFQTQVLLLHTLSSALNRKLHTPCTLP